MRFDDMPSLNHLAGEVDLVDTHAEDTALVLWMVVAPVGKPDQVDRKVDPDADIPDLLRLSSRGVEHSHIHLQAVVQAPLLEGHALVPVPVLLLLLLLLRLAACDVELTVAQRCFRKPHYAMLQRDGEQGLKGPVVSVGRLEP